MSQISDARGVAARLGVTPATVLAWARRGWVPCLRAGRRPVLFDIGAVERALDSRGSKGETSPPAAEAGDEAELLGLLIDFAERLRLPPTAARDVPQPRQQEEADRG